MKKLNRETIDKNTWELEETIHSAIRKIGVKVVASELDVSATKLGNEVNEYYNNAKWKASELYRFTASLGDMTIIDAFVRKLGGVIINLTEFAEDATDESLLDGFTNSLFHLGELGKKIQKARHIDSDNGKEITAKELQKIEKQAYQLIQTILSILAQLEPDVTNFEGK